MQTTFSSGLTPACADRAISILGKPQGAALLLTPLGPPPRGVPPPPPLPSGPHQATSCANSQRLHSLHPASQTLSSVSVATSPSLPDEPATVPSAAPPQLDTLEALLLDAGLEKLVPVVANQTLVGLLTVLHGPDGRLSLLAHLRAEGISKVSDRQAVVNAVMRAQRTGRLANACASL